MTLLGPLLMAGMMIVPIWMSMKDQDDQIIEIVDNTRLFEGQIDDTKNLYFTYSKRSVKEAKASFYDEKYTSILYIKDLSTIELIYKKQPGLITISHIENSMNRAVKNIELKRKFNITKDQLESVKSDISVRSIYMDIDGKEDEKSSVKSSVLGFLGAFLIYFFIFMYGVQVMRGVIEEKTNRIVEIIISSVKPFQLMMGKIVGIALVGLTQFISWMLIMGIIYSVAISVLSPDDLQNIAVADQLKSQGITMDQLPIDISNQEDMATQVASILDDIPIFKIIFCFVFYFLGGYLLYGALFAAIGSAVDSEADTQQFMLPITIPLIFALIFAQTIINNPDGPMAFWLSIIPLTSPVIMMVRVPFDPPMWEIALSMIMLIGGFIFTTFLAGKIYRTGILMYGKKVSYKELWKWLFYKS